MALDLAGMLTGVSKQPIDPRLNMQQQQLALGANATKMMQGGMESMRRSAGGEAPVAQQLQMAMSKLDLQNPDDLRKLISIQMATGDTVGAAKTASMLQGMKQAPLDAAEKKRIDERDYDLRKRRVEVEERGSGIKNPALIQEYNFARNEGYEGTFMEFVAAKKSPLVSTQNTPQQQRETLRIEAQSNLYKKTQEQLSAAEKNLGTAKGILGIVSSGEATGQAGATVASFATSIQSTLEVLGITVPEEIANASGTLAQMKRYAGEALMPFIEQQGRGFTDTEREYFLKNVIAGYDQPWQFNDAYGTVLLSKSLSEIEKNNFAYAVSISDDLLNKPPQNLWSEYERKVPRLKVGTKTRGGKSYEGAIVIQDNENLSQYWTKESPKGFKVANGEKPPIEYAWEDLEETAKDRNQTVRELLVDFSRGGDLIGGIY
jgi:hypothetical protein